MRRTTLLLSGLALGGGVFAFDRWTKAVFFGRETHSIFLTVLETTSHRNFGLLADVVLPHSLIIGMTGIIALFVAWAFGRSVLRTETLRALSLALILGGALGNLYDRLVFGYVFDWILLFHWSIFNVSDIAIGAGIVMFLLSYRRDLSPLPPSSRGNLIGIKNKRVLPS